LTRLPDDGAEKLTVSAFAAVTAAGAAGAEGLTPQDTAHLRGTHGLTAQSAIIAELTPNERNALHSATDEPKSIPDSRGRQVRRYLSLVYGRACERWAEGHPGQQCSPAPEANAQPGKKIADRICAECHLFGTATGHRSIRWPASASGTRTRSSTRCATARTWCP
jgi:hypothetical protein